MGDDTDTTAAVAGGLAGIFMDMKTFQKPGLTLLNAKNISTVCVLRLQNAGEKFNEDVHGFYVKEE